MGPSSSLAILVGAPAALLRAGKASWRALAWWGLLAAIICFLLAELLVGGLEPAQEWLLSRYLPPRFMQAGRWALESLAGEQLRATVVSVAVTGSMLLVSMLLFVLKEKASAVFEDESGAGEGLEHDEAPLWKIGLEEVWLVVLYAALSMASFWIGYGAPAWRQTLATGITHAALGFTLACDYIAPAMQRHGWSYPQIIRLVWGRPLLSFAFGLLFGAPVLVAVHLFGKPLPVDIERSIAIIAITQLVCLAVAIWVGTWVGASLVRCENAKTQAGLPWAVHLATWALVAFSSVTFTSVFQSAYKVLPLLKCKYKLAPGGFDMDLAGLGADVKLELQIENPTEWDASIGPNRLVLAHDGSTLFETSLPEGEVAAKSQQRHPITVPIELRGGAARKGLSTLISVHQKGWKETAKEALGGMGQLDAYDLTLYIETPTMEFPVYLQRSAASKKTGS